LQAINVIDAATADDADDRAGRMLSHRKLRVRAG
jgi:hypothetical protein